MHTQQYRRLKLSDALFAAFALLFIIISLSACTSARQLRYFNDLSDSAVVHLPPMQQEVRHIQYGDMMTIVFAGRSEEAGQFFNRYGGMPTSGGGGRNGGSNGGGAAYLVDLEGNLEFPIWGKINVVGMTNFQLEDTLKVLVTPYLKDPIVTVRFQNFKFTVLGEVRGAGIKTLDQQRTTLLDALAAAGDLPITAKRYDIQVYRDYNGERKIFKIDLRKKDILTNREHFQVKHNDIIIVKPRDVTFFMGEASLYMGLIGLLLGFVTLAITLSRRY